MDTATLKTAFKFSSVLSSGLFFGGAVYVGKTHVPGLLAVKDLSQSVLSFQYFWPRSYEMVSVVICRYCCKLCFFQRIWNLSICDDWQFLYSFVFFAVYTEMYIRPTELRFQFTVHRPHGLDYRMNFSLFKIIFIIGRFSISGLSNILLIAKPSIRGRPTWSTASAMISRHLFDIIRKFPETTMAVYEAPDVDKLFNKINFVNNFPWFVNNHTR